MPKRPRIRTARDYALIEKRYRQFLEIGALPSGERRQALNEFLDRIEGEGREETQEREAAAAGLDVSRQTEPALENLFTDVTQRKQRLRLHLAGTVVAAAFPRRSPEELGRLIVTFLDLLIADGKNRPN